VQNPKHIEVQVFGDTHGNVVHLYERECSMQRRHQKLIEESPSVSVPADVREKLGEVAVRAAKSIQYVGAGTIEFIFDNKSKEFFFMEMNTRLQVEHPVTELVVGYDLVKEQIMVALGQPLSFKQSDVKQKGHAIELRICAEDPVTFTPNPGKIRKYRMPAGPIVRVDNCAYPGYEVPIYYDPMIAKLIVWGPTRTECIQRLQRALAEYMLTGIKSNIVLHKNILVHPAFLEGSYTTQFIDQQIAGKTHRELFMFVDEPVFLIAAAIEAYNQSKSRDVSDYNIASQWKRYGRLKSMRN
jgi:acetyl-CoA carboxylase biotin carboxylase subunit